MSSSKSGNAYTRFIPREELQGFASWTPGAFGDTSAKAAANAAAAIPAAQTPPSAEQEAKLLAARQNGYQDGYRDGLVALESFKQSFAQQMSGQYGLLLQGFESQLAALEQQIAASVARVASQLARQIVRAELSAKPEVVAVVAQEAINAVLMSARHINVYVNPADQALITEGAAEALVARGARVVAQAAIERGGCLVESDAGTVDARIAQRWSQAVQALGTEVDWADPASER
ncbi:MAG: flagellar assembly protein FliH [Burkholderiales bacterium]|nr:flagellar assembly protein FliH [Burkholderiales bacterium]